MFCRIEHSHSSVSRVTLNLCWLFWFVCHGYEFAVIWECADGRVPVEPSIYSYPLMFP